ncbi:MAG: transposase [Lachnospiraceae bacterium]|nr:transposase [Lachnospiraceae bacterium]
MEKDNMKKGVILVWNRYALTIIEAAEYNHIGENKLCMVADEHPEVDFIIMNDNCILIKRQKFEEYLEHETVI